MPQVPTLVVALPCGRGSAKKVLGMSSAVRHIRRNRGKMWWYSSRRAVRVLKS
jgi:hypothetical protein